MRKQIRIDFVSDISCPWCVIGLKSLEQAVQRLTDIADVQVYFQPFELNPNMAPAGQDIGEHLAQKYGASAEQRAQTSAMIHARGAELGFDFGVRERIYNTFDAHRLLHWAGEQDGPSLQRAFKMALFNAYFTAGESVASHAVLLQAASQVGLDSAHAARILASDDYAAEVREREQFYQQQGIHSVPAIVINQRHLISGGQPPEVFEQALRQILTEE